MSANEISINIEEEAICRFCFDKGDANTFINQPCCCRGSHNMVHQDCLRKWLEVEFQETCKVCQSKYKVEVVKKDLYEEISLWGWLSDNDSEIYQIIVCSVLSVLQNVLAFWLWEWIRQSKNNKMISSSKYVSTMLTLLPVVLTTMVLSMYTLALVIRLYYKYQKFKKTPGKLIGYQVTIDKVVPKNTSAL